MKHLSVRLPWHDRGWDGHVCNNPISNVYCKGFHSVNAERIRKDKIDELEKKGENIKILQSNSENYCPPCTETINVFGSKKIKHIHYPKNFIKNTSPKEVTILPNSSGTWAFEDMWDEWGERREPKERFEYIKEYFDVVKENEGTNLLFYYCNYDNPISGNDKKYLVVGVARLKKIHDFDHWEDIPKKMSDKYGSYIWSRLIENDPNERLRIPYQEYIDNKKNPESIAIFAEGDVSRSFKYVCHHVSDDDAIVLLDEIAVSIQNIIDDKFGNQKYWEGRLEWLKQIRKECWINRGLYPGLVPVLKFLNFEKPEEYIRKFVVHKTDQNKIKEFIFEKLSGEKNITKKESSFYEDAKKRYQNMLSDDKEKIKAELCRDKFPLFDITEEQVQRILDDKRGKYSIISSLEKIYENPYSLSEEYIGNDPDDYISFSRIDHGMIPSSDLGTKIKQIKLNNPYRLRALMYEMLNKERITGNTFLDKDELFNSVIESHKKHNKTQTFNFDQTSWNVDIEKFNEKLILDKESGIDIVAIKKINSAEKNIRFTFSSLINADPIDRYTGDWKKILSETGSEVITEQVLALSKIYQSRLCVLTGTAGTGKTNVLKSLVKAIKKENKNHDFLLLAPTGKAAIILTERIDDPSLSALTIHRFLMKNDWINPNNFTLKQSGNKNNADTIIIDECSMIEVELFNTILKAINIKNIERLILVGDYNQLPPIGPGRVFYDLVSYLKKYDDLSGKCLAELNFNWRQKRGSKAAILADQFAKNNKLNEEIFEELEKGLYDLSNIQNKSDLAIEFWKDETDLIKIIPKILDFAIKDLDKNLSGDLGTRYNVIHKLDKPLSDQKKLDAIHFITPFRHTPSGVDDINMIIQENLRGKATIDNYSKWSYVFFDKVLQVRNNKYSAYNHDIAKNEKNDDTYVPNGTLGFVFPEKNEKLHVKFPKEFRKFSYYLTKKQSMINLDHGYATSVHKTQGSQFEITILIVPSDDVEFLSRELLYTALSRSVKKQIILLQKDLSLLKSRLFLGYSDIVKRNSSLFTSAKGIPAKAFDKYKPENLIHEVLPDIFVRSLDEKEISSALINNDIDFYYERPLIAKDQKSWKIPDFTFKANRKTYYWEHWGVRDDYEYDQRKERKLKWYVENGYQDNLIQTPVEGYPKLKDSIKYVFENIIPI